MSAWPHTHRLHPERRRYPPLPWPPQSGTGRARYARGSAFAPDAVPAFSLAFSCFFGFFSFAVACCRVTGALERMALRGVHEYKSTAGATGSLGLEQEPTRRRPRRQEAAVPPATRHITTSCQNQLTLSASAYAAHAATLTGPSSTYASPSSDLHASSSGQYSRPRNGAGVGMPVPVPVSVASSSAQRGAPQPSALQPTFAHSSVSSSARTPAPQAPRFRNPRAPDRIWDGLTNKACLKASSCHSVPNEVVEVRGEKAHTPRKIFWKGCGIARPSTPRCRKPWGYQTAKTQNLDGATDRRGTASGSGIISKVAPKPPSQSRGLTKPSQAVLGAWTGLWLWLEVGEAKAGASSHGFECCIHTSLWPSVKASINLQFKPGLKPKPSQAKPYPRALALA
ncbi:hypothetical protein DFH07DRAFT_771930 [Mycena maculata]|uniref:Uncharacterized protein n=1 Tax=Mycena maculata TaxID=230809 RepID=A0AAD7NFQ4_9AGAR|nr:hypothetical protein DFH07DRAFT_771930 [Mycena maculata]